MTSRAERRRIERNRGTRRNDADAPGPAVVALANESRSLRWGWIAALIVVTIVAYSNSFSGVFLFDDGPNITNSNLIRSFTPLNDLLFATTRPTLQVSLAINYAMASTDPVLSTWGFHLVNLLIHIAAGLTLFGFIRRTLLLPTFGETFRRSAVWFAGVVALLWMVHPLNTQSVTYIVQRSESMMGLCYLLTMYCFLRGATARAGMIWYVAAAIALVVGLGSKAVIVTAPVAVLLYDRSFLTSSFKESLRRRWRVYLAMFLAWSMLLITGLVQYIFFNDAGTAAIGFGYTGASAWNYLLTQPGVILHYLRLAMWPHPLVLDYGWPFVTNVAHALVPGIVVIGFLAATIWALVKHPRIGFVAACFFLILSPTSTFIPIKDAAFEHRMYLPLISVVVLLVFSVYRLGRNALSAHAFRIGAGVTVAILVGLLAGMTWNRNLDYHDSITMWRSVVEARPESGRAYVNLAAEMLIANRNDEVIPVLEKAIELEPPLAQAQREIEWFSVRYQLGNALVREQRAEESLEHFARAEQIAPHDIRAYVNHGNALSVLRRYSDAADKFREAINSQPISVKSKDLGRAYFNLGNMLRHLGLRDEAIEAYKTVATMRPGYIRAQIAYADMLMFGGSTDEARAIYEHVLRRDPNHATAQSRLKQIEMSSP